MKKIYGVLGLLGVASAFGLYYWHAHTSGDMTGMMGGTPEVSVVTIKSEPVVLTRDLPGRTSAFRVAEIRPQVSGIILKRFFEEGSEVKEGEQLYQIDPAPYQASYNSARADLAKAEANLKSVEAKSARYEELLKVGGISQQDYDDTAASLAQAKADIAIAKASVATAKINLDYTKVFSPISGRVGQSKVTEGALVNADQTEALAVVQQLDRIYVDVSQSSDELIQLKKLHQKENDNGDIHSEKSSSVRLIVDGKPTGEEGELKFSDVSVNPTTGTVLLRVLFPNPSYDILPGMFVQARLEQWRNDNGIVVPQKSVSRQADGSVSVWIVGADNKANLRPITVGEALGDKWIVNKGLQPGDRVIVEGTMKVQPGMEVKAVEQSPLGSAVSGTAVSPTQLQNVSATESSK